MNIIASKTSKKIDVIEGETLMKMLEYVKKINIQNKGEVGLYNLSTFKVLERGNEPTNFSYLMIDYEKQEGNFNNKHIKHLDYHWYTSYNSGLHMLITLNKEYSISFWNKHSSTIKNIVASWGVGKNLDKGALSPSRWFFVPHTKKPKLSIRRNEGTPLDLTNLVKLKTAEPSPVNTNLKKIIEVIISKYGGTWHNDDLFPFVQSCKRSGISEKQTRDYWERLKDHENSQDRFESNWNSKIRNEVYTYRWLYSKAGIKPKTEDLNTLLEKYNVRADIGQNQWSYHDPITNTCWLPSITNRVLMMDFLTAHSAEPITRNELLKAITATNRKGLIPITDLYKANVLTFNSEDKVNPDTIDLIMNLCDNGDGNQELQKFKFDMLMKWLYQVIFGPTDKLFQLWAPHFFGSARAGKTIFCEMFNVIYQTPNAMVAMKSSSGSEFNGEIKFARVLAYEETNKSKINMERLKEEMMAERITVNDKFIRKVMLPNNYVRLFLSNQWTTGLNLENDSGFLERWSFFRVANKLSTKYPNKTKNDWHKALKTPEAIRGLLNFIQTNYKNEELLEPLHQDCLSVKRLEANDFDIVIGAIAKNPYILGISHSAGRRIAEMLLGGKYALTHYKSRVMAAFNNTGYRPTTQCKRTDVPFRYGWFLFDYKKKDKYSKFINYSSDDSDELVRQDIDEFLNEST